MSVEIAAAYAPVAGFEMTLVEGAVVSGLAYPSHGPLCSAVKLSAGGHFMGAVRADGFSESAAARGLREGWCRFSIQLDRADFIFADEIIFSCLASAKTLGSIVFKDVDFGMAAAHSSRRRSVNSLVRPEYNKGLATADGERYFSLIERTAAEISDRDFIYFAFRLLLNREPDQDGFTFYMTEFDHGLSRAQFLRIVISSEEFKSIYDLPSPFDEAFPGVPVFAPLPSI